MDHTEELIRRSQEGDKEARETLIEENMGLIHHVVKRFLGRGVEAEDLFQIGAIGLMKAIFTFADTTIDKVIEHQMEMDKIRSERRNQEVEASIEESKARTAKYTAESEYWTAKKDY